MRCWGARGTIPSPGAATVRYGGHTSCVEVRGAADTLLVLDAGTGIRALGAAMQRDGDHAKVHIVLSHRHGDHVLGLPHFAPLILRDRPVCLHSGNSDARTLRPFLEALLSPPMFPQLAGVIGRLDVCDWGDDGTTLINGHIAVHRLAAAHPGEAAVLRIDDSTGPAIAYAPDNELAYADSSPAVRAWRGRLAGQLRGIPLLIHDATYVDAELARHIGWGHSSAEEATRFALECEAKELLLFHHHPDRSDDAIDELVARCRGIVAEAGKALQVNAAAEGAEYFVG